MSRYLRILLMRIIVAAMICGICTATPMWSNCAQVPTSVFYIPASGEYESIDCNISSFVNVSAATSDAQTQFASARMEGGTVAAGTSNGIFIIGANPAIASTMGPLRLSIRNIIFGLNAILKVTDAFPPGSEVFISNNSFTITDLHTNGIDSAFFFSGAVYSTLYAAIIIGHPGVRFSLSASAQFHISENTISFGNLPVINTLVTATGVFLLPTAISLTTGATLRVDANLVQPCNSSFFLGLDVATVRWQVALETKLEMSGATFSMNLNTAQKINSLRVSAVLWRSLRVTYKFWVTIMNGATLRLDGNLLVGAATTDLANTVWWDCQYFSIDLSFSSVLSVSNNAILNTQVATSGRSAASFYWIVSSLSLTIYEAKFIVNDNRVQFTSAGTVRAVSWELYTTTFSVSNSLLSVRGSTIANATATLQLCGVYILFRQGVIFTGATFQISRTTVEDSSSGAGAYVGAFWLTATSNQLVVSGTSDISFTYNSLVSANSSSLTRLIYIEILIQLTGSITVCDNSLLVEYSQQNGPLSLAYFSSQIQTFQSGSIHVSRNVLKSLTSTSSYLSFFTALRISDGANVVVTDNIVELPTSARAVIAFTLQATSVYQYLILFKRNRISTLQFSPSDFPGGCPSPAIQVTFNFYQVGTAVQSQQSPLLITDNTLTSRVLPNADCPLILLTLTNVNVAVVGNTLATNASFPVAIRLSNYRKGSWVSVSQNIVKSYYSTGLFSLLGKLTEVASIGQPIRLIVEENRIQVNSVTAFSLVSGNHSVAGLRVSACNNAIGGTLICRSPASYLKLNNLATVPMQIDTCYTQTTTQSSAPSASLSNHLSSTVSSTLDQTFSRTQPSTLSFDVSDSLESHFTKTDAKLTITTVAAQTASKERSGTSSHSLSYTTSHNLSDTPNLLETLSLSQAPSATPDSSRSEPFLLSETVLAHVTMSQVTESSSVKITRTADRNESKTLPFRTHSSWNATPTLNATVSTQKLTRTESILPILHLGDRSSLGSESTAATTYDDTGIIFIGDPLSLEVHLATAILLGPCATVGDHTMARYWRYVLSPWMDYGANTVGIVHGGIALGALFIHFLLVIILSRTLACTWFSASVRMFFPSLSCAVALILLPGSVIAITDMFREGPSTGGGLTLALAHVLVVCGIMGVIQWKWRALGDCTVREIVSGSPFDWLFAAHATWDGASQRMLLSVRWLVKDTTPGTALAPCAIGFFVVIALVLFVSSSGCAARQFITSLLCLAAAVAIALFRPIVSRFANISTVISLLSLFIVLLLHGVSTSSGFSGAEGGGGLWSIKTIALIVLFLSTLARTIHFGFLIFFDSFDAKGDCYTSEVETSQVRIAPESFVPNSNTIKDNLSMMIANDANNRNPHCPNPHCDSATVVIDTVFDKDFYHTEVEEFAY